MRKRVSNKAVVSQEQVDLVEKITAQLRDANVDKINVDGLIQVLTENNTISGNTVKALQDALTRIGRVQPVINVEAAPVAEKPTRWSIEINRDSRGEASSYDLVPHFAESVN